MYKTYARQPGIVPWGHPLVILVTVDRKPLTDTRKLLLVRLFESRLKIKHYDIETVAGVDHSGELVSV